MVSCGGGRQGHHQIDDVARGAELAVLPGRGDFAEHVFPQVALGVVVVERNGVEQVHHPLQQRAWDGEGASRMWCAKTRFRRQAARGLQAAQEGEDLVAEHVEHLSRAMFLKRTSACCRAAALRIHACGDEAHGLGFEAQGFVVFAVWSLSRRAKEQVR